MTGRVSWAAKLPGTWDVKPLKAVASYSVSGVDKVPVDDEKPVRLCNYTDVYNNEFVDMSADFMMSTATDQEIEKFRLEVNDVVITKDSESWDDIGVPALVTETSEDLLCGYHLAKLSPFPEKVCGRFLLRCLQAKPIHTQLELASKGVTRFGLPKEAIGKLLLPIPPLRQQCAIADFLDKQTAGLDALIKVKERLLGILAEKRQALITHAVTRGLNPNVAFRDSGNLVARETPSALASAAPGASFPATRRTWKT